MGPPCPKPPLDVWISGHGTVLMDRCFRGLTCPGEEAVKQKDLCYLLPLSRLLKAHTNMGLKSNPCAKAKFRCSAVHESFLL